MIPMSGSYVCLFVGYAVDEEFQQALGRANPHALDLFINNNSDYLHRLEGKEGVFLGKFLGRLENLNALEALEANVKSLLLKLVPTLSFQERCLQVVAVSRD